MGHVVQSIWGLTQNKLQQNWFNLYAFQNTPLYNIPKTLWYWPQFRVIKIRESKGLRVVYEFQDVDLNVGHAKLNKITMP
jgi:hypothetical protein